MEENMSKGAILVSSLIGFAIGIIVHVLICYFAFPILADKVYGWWGGIWQGLFVIGNALISVFKEGWYVIAPQHTGAYMVWWWISAIWIILFFIRYIIGIVKKVRS